MTENDFKCKRLISQSIGIQYFTLSVCAISLLSTLLVFSAFIIYRREASRYVKKFKNTNLRMRTLMYMNVFGLIYSALLLVQSILVSSAGKELYLKSWWFYKYPYCQVQAAVAHWTSLSLNAWNVCCTLHLFVQLMSGYSFASLRRLFRRFEHFFILLTFGVIPLPFLIMVFKLPLAGTDRWILLYGKPYDKLWCDFANMPDVNGQGQIETKWAIFWEIGFFYTPNILMLLFSILLYVIIAFRIRKNSKQLKERAKRLAHQTGDLYHQTIKDKELSTEIGTNAQPVIHGSTTETAEAVTVDVGPIHAPLALTDYDQYMKFLQLQATTASYYIICLGINWMVWVTARVIWQFTDCSTPFNSSPIMTFFLKVIYVIMECSGPRIDCLLLSIVYGLAENTVTPKRFEELVGNSLVVPILKDYCAKHWHVPVSEQNKGGTGQKIYDTVSNFVKLSPTESGSAEYSKLSSARRPAVQYRHPPLSYEDILYFWYDVQRLRDYKHNHGIFAKRFLHEATLPKLNADLLSAQTLEKVDMFSGKIYSLTQDIFSQYFAPQSPLMLYDFLSSSALARFERLVNESAAFLKDDNQDIDDEEPLRHVSSPLNKDLFANTDEYLDTKVRDYETEFITTSRHVYYALRLLSSAEKLAEEHLQYKTRALLSSRRIEEIQMVLRVKSKTASRSLYRDVVERAWHKVEDVAKSCKQSIKAKWTQRRKKLESVDSDSDTDSEDDDKKKDKKKTDARSIDPAIYVYIRAEKKNKLKKLLRPTLVISETTENIE